MEMHCDGTPGEDAEVYILRDDPAILAAYNERMKSFHSYNASLFFQNVYCYLYTLVWSCSCCPFGYFIRLYEKRLYHS